MKKSDFLLKEKTVKINNGFAVPIIIGEWLRSVEESNVTSLKEGISSEFTRTLAQVASDTLGMNISAEEDELEVFDKTDFGFVIRTKEFDVKVDFVYKSSDVEIDPQAERILSSKFGCACQVYATFLGENKVSKEGKVYVEFNYSLQNDGLKISFGINKQHDQEMLIEIAGTVVNLIAEMINAVLPTLMKTDPSPAEEPTEEELVD